MMKKLSLVLLIILLLAACSFPKDVEQGVDEVGSSQNYVDLDSVEDDLSGDEVVGDHSDSVSDSVDTDDVIDVPLEFDFKTLPQGDQIGAEYAGLLYTNAQEEGAWIVDSDGFGRRLIDTGDGFEFNPDTFQIAYLAPIYEEDIFLYDLITGETTQLTDTPDLLENNLAFLPGTDLLTFNYMPKEQLGPWAGYLGAVDIKTGEFLILDDQSSSCCGFAVSPRDGTILYDDQGLPFWYSLETGPVDVSMDYYAPDFSSFASPAFSPDGSKLTFHAYGGSDGTSAGINNGIVVIDTNTGTSQVLHPYESFGQRVGPDVVWSPNGSWIAIVTQGEIEAADNGVGLWMINPNSAESDEQLIGSGTTPIWSPDGMILLYTDWGTGSYLEAKIMQVLHDFSTAQVPLPPGNFPFQWVDLEK
jgi:hypothetical protein